MKSSQVTAAAFAGFAQIASAAISSVVSGTPMGFAADVTGGGDVDPVYPTTIDDLKEYLTSADPQVIVISGEFDFTGSEGSETDTACDAYSCTPDNGGQALLNSLNGCASDATLYDVTLDTAGTVGIEVTSNKTLVGKDDATLNGKGLRLVGVENIIIQNIHITNLNPQYVWGGDAISMASTNLIWIDHVKTSNLGRQHYSFGQDPNAAVTISNSYISGATDYSATCDGHSYWGFEMVGTGDFITLYQNLIDYTSGRSPALSGSTMLHSINNVWSQNSGHLIEGTETTASGLYEGNYFDNTPTIIGDDYPGQFFSSDEANLSQCQTYLGRDCVTNELGDNTGTFSGWDDTDFMSNFEGTNIPEAAAAADIFDTVKASAGNTL